MAGRRGLAHLKNAPKIVWDLDIKLDSAALQGALKSLIESEITEIMDDSWVDAWAFLHDSPPSASPLDLCFFCDVGMDDQRPVYWFNLGDAVMESLETHVIQSDCGCPSDADVARVREFSRQLRVLADDVDRQLKRVL